MDRQPQRRLELEAGGRRRDGSRPWSLGAVSGRSRNRAKAHQREARGNIPSVIEQAVVSLTSDAQVRLKELLAKEGNPQLALRIFVSGGGCSGMQYGMAFDDMRRPEDVTIDQDGVQIVIDDFSAPYIRGSEIDYVDSLMGAGFTVHNPNAVHSCSCGHSFDTGDDAGGAQACGCGH